MLFKKGTKAYSMFNYKCPRCHEGDLYPTSTFSFKKPFEMHKNCSVCGQKYELEAGFYWGSMYVSYTLTGGYMLGGFAVLFFLFGLDIVPCFVILIIGIIILYPWFFRTARSIWINLFVKYDPNYGVGKTPVQK